MRFIKSHALGNDYLVLCSGEALHPELVTRICHRNMGLGSDGILEPIPADGGDYGLRIWNPDGSQAEKSGNGLRIFARWLRDHQGAAEQFVVDVPAGHAECQLHSDGSVTVDMGHPVFHMDEIPTREEVCRRLVVIGEQRLELCAVSVGNPHCVVLFGPGTDLDELPWQEWGSAIERHLFFPQRTNVQFMTSISDDQIGIRIWERGAGATLASGSSAVAAFAVARRLGWIVSCGTVEMPGGVLQVEEKEAGNLAQTGPVEEIGQMWLAKGYDNRVPARELLG